MVPFENARYDRVVQQRTDAMNDQTDTLDQTDEEILTTAVSDEVLEATAGTQRDAAFSSPYTYGRGAHMTCC